MSTPTPTPTPPPPPPPVPSNNFQITASSDDVNEQILGGSTILYSENNSQSWAGNANDESWLGLRFSSVNIPQGSTINSARIKVKSNQLQNIVFRGTVYGQTSDNPATFSSSSRPSQRGSLTSGLNIADTSQWLNSSWYYLTPDIKAVVQQIVIQSNWLSSDPMVFIIKGVGEAWEQKTFYSFDGSPLDAPILEVNHTP